MKGCLGKLLLLVGLGVFTLIVGGYFLIKSYIRSEEFMTLAQYALSKKVGGQVQITGTDWDGWSFKNENIQISDAQPFHSLEAERISVEIDPRGFFDQVWLLEQVHIPSLNVQVHSSKISQAHGKGSQPKSTNQPPTALPVTFDWKDSWKALLPRTAEVNNVTVEHFNGGFSSEAIQGKWHNLHLQLSREAEDYLADITRGHLTLSHLPAHPFLVDSLSARIKPDSYFINNGELSGKTGGTLTFSGEGDYAGGLSIAGELQDLPLTVFLKDDWLKRIQGSADGTFTIIQTDYNGIKAEGECNIKEGLLTALPAFSTLAKQTGDNRFNQIVLDHCTCNYEIANGVTTLTDIHLESDDFLKVEGTLTTTGKSGDGTVFFGIHEPLLKKFPTGTDSIFLPESLRDGYVWTEVKVTQHDGQWREDLSPRMVKAVASAILSQAPEGAAALLEGVAQLIAPSTPEQENSPDQNTTEETLKKGTDLIETGVKSLFELLGR